MTTSHQDRRWPAEGKGFSGALTICPSRSRLQTVSVYLASLQTWGSLRRRRGLDMCTSYFEMRSFPLAFVQFRLFHVKRVFEQRLGFGFELHRPVPHSEEIQRPALCALAFPALPKQAQVTALPAGLRKANTALETGPRKARPACPESQPSRGCSLH